MDDCVGKGFTMLIEEIVRKREKEFQTESNIGGRNEGVNLNEKKKQDKKCGC